jgi:hypothetical protein
VWTSAGQTGGGKRMRFVTDPDCQLEVARVTLTPAGDDSFGVMRAELAAKGFNRTDRKYLVCGGCRGRDLHHHHHHRRHRSRTVHPGLAATTTCRGASFSGSETHGTADSPR